MKVKLVHGGGGGGDERGGTLSYRGESSPHITLILKMQPVMPTGFSHASPSLQLSTDTAGKGPACSLPCLSSGAFSCLSDTAEKGPAVSTATLQKS